MNFLKNLFNRNKTSRKEIDDKIYNTIIAQEPKNAQQEAVRGMFLGIYEQTLRILHKNIDTIPEEVKKLPFFYEALITYIDLYSVIVVSPHFPSFDLVSRMVIREFFKGDYKIIDNLPQSKARNFELPWVRAMAKNIQIFGINNTALLATIEGYMEQKTGKTIRYGIPDTDETSPTIRF